MICHSYVQDPTIQVTQTRPTSCRDTLMVLQVLFHQQPAPLRSSKVPAVARPSTSALDSDTAMDQDMDPDMGMDTDMNTVMHMDTDTGTDTDTDTDTHTDTDTDIAKRSQTWPLSQEREEKSWGKSHFLRNDELTAQNPI